MKDGSKMGDCFKPKKSSWFTLHVFSLDLSGGDKWAYSVPTGHTIQGIVLQASEALDRLLFNQHFQSSLDPLSRHPGESLCCPNSILEFGLRFLTVDMFLLSQHVLNV